MKTLYQILTVMSTYNFMDVPTHPEGRKSEEVADLKKYHKML
jgi:hypothetical protein